MELIIRSPFGREGIIFWNGTAVRVQNAADLDLSLGSIDILGIYHCPEHVNHRKWAICREL